MACKDERKRSRKRPARQWLDDVAEWTNLHSNVVRCGGSKKDCVVGRKHVSRVASNIQNRYGIQDGGVLRSMCICARMCSCAFVCQLHTPVQQSYLVLTLSHQYWSTTN